MEDTYGITFPGSLGPHVHFMPRAVNGFQIMTPEPCLYKRNRAIQDSAQWSALDTPGPAPAWAVSGPAWRDALGNALCSKQGHVYLTAELRRSSWDEPKVVLQCICFRDYSGASLGISVLLFCCFFVGLVVGDVFVFSCLLFCVNVLLHFRVTHFGSGQVHPPRFLHQRPVPWSCIPFT